MPKRRLLWQLYPSFLAITLVAVGIAGYWTVHEFEEFARQTPRAELESRAEFLRSELQGAAVRSGDSPGGDNQSATANAAADRAAGQSEKVPPAESFELPPELLADGRRWAQAAGVRWTIVARSGHVVWDSQRSASDVENQADRPEFRRALAGEVGHGTRREPTDPAPIAVAALPLRSRGKVVGVVEASRPLAAIDQSISALQTRVLAVGVGAVILAALVSIWSARRISRPLEEMRRGAERFARGELHYKLRPPVGSELAGLAESLNEMAAQLHERIGTIVRQNNEQRAVLGSMVEGVLAVDNHERIISLNKAASQLLAIDPTSAQGRSLQEVVRNADLRRFITRALECREPIDDDVTLHGDYEGVLQARGAALHDAAHRAIGAVIVLNDVTDFRRLEHIRRDFVANVSHELKTPVTSIKGFVETLLDGAMHDPQDTERFLTIVAKQADRLNSIIDDLLSLSRIEQGEENADIQLTLGSIRDVIETAVAACQHKTGERRINVQAACDEAVDAHINSQLLEQAVINLLDNAIKYSEPGGEVQVLASSSDGEVTISVSDHGVGIAAKHLSRVFERFYRVDKARSRKLGGTGLGLAIVKHIVQAHGGRVTVKSMLGSGSTFTIHLPAPAKDDAAKHDAAVVGQSSAADRVNR